GGCEGALPTAFDLHDRARAAGRDDRSRRARCLLRRRPPRPLHAGAGRGGGRGARPGAPRAGAPNTTRSGPRPTGPPRPPPPDVVEVAEGRSVELAPEARERMAASRTMLEVLLERGDRIYGVTTGVGAIKTVGVVRDEQAAFNRLMLHAHSVGHGTAVPA